MSDQTAVPAENVDEEQTEVAEVISDPSEIVQEEVVPVEAVVEEEVVEEDDSIDLTREIISEGLSTLARTSDGLNFAYVKCELREKKLRNLDGFKTGTGYPHIRNADFSQNALVDISCLTLIPNILTLNLEDNKLTTVFQNVKMNFMQLLNLNKNKISTFGPVEFPLLTSLSLNNNVLTSWEQSHRLPLLQSLSLRNNKLTAFDGKNLPALQLLDLRGNGFTAIESITNIPNVTTLNLRGNSNLSLLTGFVGPAISNLNLRACQLLKLQNILPLRTITGLKKLNLMENECSVGGDEVRLIILSLLPSISILDKTNVSPEERDLANSQAEENRKAVQISGISDPIEISPEVEPDSESSAVLSQANDEESAGEDDVSDKDGEY